MRGATGHLRPHSPLTRRREQDSSPWTAQILLLYSIASAVKFFPRQPNPIAVTLKHATSALNCPLGKWRRYKRMQLLYEGLWSLSEDRNAVAGWAKARQRRAHHLSRAYFFMVGTLSLCPPWGLSRRRGRSPDERSDIREQTPTGPYGLRTDLLCAQARFLAAARDKLARRANHQKSVQPLLQKYSA